MIGFDYLYLELISVKCISLDLSSHKMSGVNTNLVLMIKF